ncbi:hypothetical protein TUSST3_45530 [Streptomyces sp. TUS-ST3]|uniref:hypothetical protein n=1 Tax=Streptomyces sp. TUS-ST3 TaxID=3025591 RepID=UPI00235B5649|nr:hypothetical protein [Streptomyces sp. TUS-ST3]GLP67931.1 hypothetical protein TUSST3_45530 [Streptomyces sp. TUS-ST3]
MAAPLLTAAALSLAGVVAGADDQFLLPGPTLILLVITAMTLIYSMQLSYNARYYFYTFADLEDWFKGVGDGSAPKSYVRAQHKLAQRMWRTRNAKAVAFYNLGTLLLGLGVTASLAPPDCGKQTLCRWIAAGIVLTGSIADAIWILRMKPPAGADEIP